MLDSFYGAGLKDGQIQTADGQLHDIFAIVEMNGEPEVDDTEVNGDDELKGVFYSNRRENLTVTANGLRFDTIQAITGNQYASSPSGFEIPLGTDSENVPPEVAVIGYTNARDKAGTVCRIMKRFERVQFSTPNISMAGEQEFNIEMTGVARPSDTDILGNALNPKRVATLKVFAGAAS